MPARDPATPTTLLVHGARWMTFAMVAVGLLNYAYSLGLTHLLAVGAFAVFAAGQALLLSAGQVARTSVPWVLAQSLATASGRAQRSRAIWFCVVTNTVLAAIAGIAAGLICLGFASPATAAVTAIGAALIFLSSTTSGYLQGEKRFRALGILLAAEPVIKIVAGLVLVAAGTGAAGALGGFAAGAAVLVAAGVVLIWPEVRTTPAGGPARAARATGGAARATGGAASVAGGPARAAGGAWAAATGALRVRSLWRSAAGIAGIQGLVVALVSIDVVLLPILAGPTAQAAGYQASMILSRVPVFLAGAVSMSLFPLLARDDAAVLPLLRAAGWVYAALTVPYALALMTVPPALLDLAFPPAYTSMAALVPITAAAGALAGGVNLLTSAFQGRRYYLRSIRLQAAGLAIDTVALLAGLALGGVRGFAFGALTGTAVTLALLSVSATRLWPGALRLPVPLLVGAVVLGAVLLALRGAPVAWALVAAAAGSTAAVLVLGRLPHPRTRPPAPDAAAPRPDGADRPRLRILHLGFEDWRKPGSGGGAVRTREVDERLARHHDMTVLVSRYHGARPRVENGVRYVPVGLPLGYRGGILSYFAALPLAIRRHDADLVVEDFAAPIGSVVPSHWTGRPLVAVVQWLNAAEKSRQYHLPFEKIQAIGVRRHHRFVAMSEDLAARLRAGNPTAEVTVVPNGVPPEAFGTSAPRGDDIVYLGRLEIEQKGVDMLLSAVASVRDRLPGRVILAGDGPDRAALAAQVSRSGLEDVVEFAGRVDGEPKLRLLAGARLVATPSRFETFGLVAAEALACGTPVVAFDIPCLREVVTPETGVLVPAFDVSAYARALVALAGDRERIERLGHAGRAHARRYDWDDVAARQEAVYLRAYRESTATPAPAGTDSVGGTDVPR